MVGAVAGMDTAGDHRRDRGVDSVVGVKMTKERELSLQDCIESFSQHELDHMAAWKLVLKLKDGGVIIGYVAYRYKPFNRNPHWGDRNWLVRDREKELEEIGHVKREMAKTANVVLREVEA